MLSHLIPHSICVTVLRVFYFCILNGTRQQPSSRVVRTPRRLRTAARVFGVYARRLMTKDACRDDDTLKANSKTPSEGLFAKFIPRQRLYRVIALLLPRHDTCSTLARRSCVTDVFQVAVYRLYMYFASLAADREISEGVYFGLDSKRKETQKWCTYI